MFKKGWKGGPGRPKGSITVVCPEKVYRKFQEIADQWNPFDELIELLPKLRPEKRADILIQIAPYFAPRLKEVTYSVTQATLGHTDLSKASFQELLPMIKPALESHGLTLDQLKELH